MKSSFLIAVSTFIILMAAGCTKELEMPKPNAKTYVINANCHYPSPDCNNFNFLDGLQTPRVTGTYMERGFKFDSTAEYVTRDKSHQGDINKLFGFADCNVAMTESNPHHVHSARVGWRWTNNEIQLFAYTYANKVRQSKQIGTVKPGEVAYARIRVDGNHYVFSYNGVDTLMDRGCNSVQYKGFELFPYFGGEETAPRMVHIQLY